MKNNLSKIIFAAIIVISFSSYGQEDDIVKSNIQTYTPSKLLNKGQWDVKFFNGLYTETKGTSKGVKADKPRETYFTTTVEVFTGVTDSNRLNLGLLLEYRSNTIGGKSATSVFGFSDDNQSRNGLSSFAPALKWQPIENVANFSIQSAFHIPIISDIFCIVRGIFYMPITIFI